MAIVLTLTNIITEKLRLADKLLNNRRYHEGAARSTGPGKAHRDRRRAQRQPSERNAYITFSDNSRIVQCDILDISDKGARIRPSDASLVPKFFELRMPAGGAYLCEVTRRKDDYLGVQFLQFA